MEELHENADEAGELREQACEIVEYIADRAGDEGELRASFLAQPEVVRVLTRANKKIAN